MKIKAKAYNGLYLNTSSRYSHIDLNRNQHIPYYSSFYAKHSLKDFYRKRKNKKHQIFKAKMKRQPDVWLKIIITTHR